MTTQTQPDPIDDLLSQAAACLEDKRYLKARKLCEKVLAKDPRSAPGHMLMAGVLEGREDVQGAIASYRKAVDCDPHHFPSWVNMGVCLKQATEYYDAIDAFKTALEMDPDSLIVQYNLARTFFEANRMIEAIDMFKSVLKQRPGWAEVQFNLGLAYQRLGRQDEALTHHRQAVHLKPDYPTAHTELAYGLQAQGKFDEAAGHLQKALNGRADYGRAHYLMASMHPDPQAARDQIDQLETHLNTGDLQPHARMNMHYAAACLHDQAGEYDTAFEHSRRANNLFKRDFGAFTDKAAQSFRNVQNMFAPELFERHAERRTTAANTILIAGLPRSGLTLVEQIISAHPEATVGGEMVGFMEEGHTEASGSERTEQFQEKLSNSSAEDLDLLAQRYLDVVPAHARAASLVTDRVSYAHGRLGLVSLLFPATKVILCRRDPMDLCWSSYFACMPERMGYTSDLRDLATISTHHQKLLDHWASTLPNPVLEVDYEKLVSEPEQEIRRIIEFLELDWNADCLNFPEKGGPVTSPCFWEVRQPIFETSVGKWKCYEQHLDALRAGLHTVA